MNLPPPIPAAGAPTWTARVLLAEDDLVTQRTVQRMLEKRGYTVVATNNGREALRALDRESFDVVVMDVQMPEMGGWETTIAIRERGAAQGGTVPIVALTASAAPGDRESCLAAGMNGYVRKPVVNEELIAEIETLVRRDSVA